MVLFSSSAPKAAPAAVGMDPEVTRRMSIADVDAAGLATEAANATEAELGMGLMQSIRLYPKAVFWSLFFSTAVIMEGFDKTLIGNLYAYDVFQRKFGERQPNGSYELTAAWQAGLSNGALVGEITGLFLNGIIAERFGYRKTMIGGLVAVTAFVFIIFFSESLVQLLIGEILIGIPWGIFQTLTVTYASEVCPTHLRAYLTTYVNLCWVMGQLIASGVLRAMIQRTDEWGYKIPFALQWMWPVPLIIGIFFAPESPWWLVRKERLEDAKASLLRLTSRNQQQQGFNPDETVSMMVHTNELEKAAQSGTTYADCFKGIDLRRTEIVCCVWAIQTLCGSTFMGYSTYFYQQAGMAKENSFSMSLGQYAIGAIGTVFSWFLMQHFGRRTLYLTGQAIMCAVLATIGFVSFAGRDNVAAQWAIGSLLLVYTFFYDCTVGPVCYSLVSELSSTRLRTKTVVLARNLYNITGIVTNILTPLMLNPSAWNWGAKSGLFWAVSCFICFVWTWFRLPEPRGRTYGELEVLFEQHLPARKFRKTEVAGLTRGAHHDDKLSEKEAEAGVSEIEKTASS
ncbi:Sugar porter family MFS transporter [Colletotrichum higginsianum IMI 349063]|uniref:Sugar porter family MFS transporter n=3 Tax=Colletotrichum higginsianum TaxID=80884 RepID=A0A1B7XXH7_COLHI|nr:Sugar porter family MFS transporter [Colletotrichum higginsianum IMI 349063]OBR04459.1 Sugar porter family MFS transporter [Colletotrichum higginsianum IMI 349063]TIC89696.1 General alpha-glucoside permease [Colletotrichum higginsianum]GJC99096.1 sugar porter family MFS transporter [Colletotrichum higginsianum]